MDDQKDVLDRQAVLRIDRVASASAKVYQTRWKIADENYPRPSYRRYERVLAEEIVLEGPHAVEECIARLGPVTALYIRGIRFGHLSEAIWELSSLLLLQANHNNLEDLPALLSRLTNLTMVKLGSNQFKRIPRVLMSMKSLTCIDLSFNQISEIESFPEECWSNVKTLDLEGNALGKLPPSIMYLKSLKDLELRNCRLKEIPENIGRLKKLRELDVSHNQLTEIPAAIKGCISLERLCVKNNKIKVLPKELFEIKSLAILEAGNNLLTEVPDKIARQCELRNINLSRNQLSCVPEALVQLQSLAVLNISNNRLKHIPLRLARMKNSYLECEGNPFDNSAPDFDVQVNRLRPLQSLAVDCILNEEVVTNLDTLAHGLRPALSNQESCNSLLCDRKITEASRLRVVFKEARISEELVTLEASVCSPGCARQCQEEIEIHRKDPNGRNLYQWMGFFMRP